VNVTVDLIEDLSCREQGGVVVELRRKALVRGVSRVDWTVLTAALQASGVPQPNQPLPEDINLYLESRDARVIDKEIVEVILNYRRVGRSVFRRDLNEFSVQIGTSLSQVPTNVDAYGQPMNVEHTFSGHPIFGDETFPQGLTLNVDVPQTVVRIAGTLATSYPDIITRGWTNYLNADYWLNDAPGTWLCVRCDAELLERGLVTSLWMFTFEFQNQSEGWQPQGVFIDASEYGANRPPADIVSGVGSKQFTWYPSRTFYDWFPV